MRSRIRIGILLLVFLIPAMSSFASKKIKASAAPREANMATGQVITVPIMLRMQDFPASLGSYTASLRWDTKNMAFVGATGGNSSGFESPVVNADQAGKGILTFANANAHGAEGEINILNVRFKVVSDKASRHSLELQFSALAAAKTFTDLLPYLEQTMDEAEPTELAEVPKEYRLEQNYPNPFNAGTVIRFAIPEEETVHLIIYDVTGARIRTLVNERSSAGYYAINWDGRDEHGTMAASGLYYFKLEVGPFTAMRKMLFVK